MSVLWQKIRFDLLQNKARTLLAVLSIAAGVFSIGAIFGMVDQLITGMDSAHRAVFPSHINIFVRNFVDNETIEDLRTIDGVAGIDPSNQISVRYKTSERDGWELGTLVMRPDYPAQTYDVLLLNEGNWPEKNKFAIERLTSQYYGIEPGSEVIFEIAGESRSFEIDGKVRHPFVQPPAFGGQAHFFTDAAGLAEFGIPEGRYGQLLIRVDDYSLTRAQEIAGEIRSRLGNAGFGVAVTIYQDPDAHWGRMFVEGINLVLQIMAGVSLVMSVILVTNTLTALITQQTDQIGVIKSVGGRRWRIIGVYLAGIMAYGLLALLIALPLGAGFAFWMSQWFLNLFNIDYEVFQISTRAVWLQAGAAVLAPLLAGLPPILKGARITVREAIASYGLGGDFGSSRLDRLVDRVGARFLDTSFAASLGNMFRRKGRLALTLTGLTISGVMFMIVMSLISSVNLTLDNDMARRGYDIRIGFVADQPRETAAAIADETPGVQASETWFSRNATFLREGERLQDSAGLGAQLVGIPSGTDMFTPIIVEGRWLEPGDERAIVVSQETADQNDIFVGDTIGLDLPLAGTANWTVVGLYRVVYGGGFVVEPVYAPVEAVLAALGMEDTATQVLVRADAATLAAANRIADDLKARYEDAGMQVDLYTTSIKLEERAYADNQFASVISMLLSLAGLAATVGGISLMGALGISVVERRREIGVMRAIGARSGRITAIFVMEGLFQGLLSWLAAVPLAFVLAQPLARLLGRTMLEVDLDYAFSSGSVWVWLVTILVIAAFASILPARNAARVSVRESLAYS